MSQIATDIFLMCGSGGVGKTTMSAALGLKFAEDGKKVIVLTIDPAKRLATSLGIEQLGDTPKRINTSSYVKGQGEMWAMMLDTKRTFDRLVERYAPSEESKSRILNNKIYKHLSQMLAGSQEYMAMERLYEIWQQDKYDVIVVDTPPMQNAIDFLEAPDKLNNMIGHSMLHLLIKPTLAVSKTGFKLFEKGSQQILKIFDRIVGFAFVQDLSEMLIAFEDLLGGFQERAKLVKSLLQNPDTNFVTVCTTQKHSVEETQNFAVKLKDFDYHLRKIIVNRVYPGRFFSKEKIANDKKSLQKIFGKEDSEVLVENYLQHVPLIKRDNKAIADLSQLLGKEHIQSVPLFLSDIHDLKSLALIAGQLQQF